MLDRAHFADKLAGVLDAKDDGGGVALTHDFDAAFQDLQHTVNRIAFAKEKSPWWKDFLVIARSRGCLSHRTRGALTQVKSSGTSEIIGKRDAAVHHRRSNR